MSTDVHSNKLRSHLQFEIKDGRKVAMELVGKKEIEDAETKLMQTIIERVPEGDETSRKFDIRHVVSIYCVYSEIKPLKEKETPKKVPKTNGKKDKTAEVETKKVVDEIVNGKNNKAMAGLKKAALKAIEDSEAKGTAVMDIKNERPTSTQLINTDSLDSSKNVVQEAL